MPTIEPLNFVDYDLWETLLWCSQDCNDCPLDDNHTVGDADLADANKLREQYYQWRESADQIMIDHGLGDWALDDLLKDRTAHCYVLVREGHGVSMADDWLSGPEYACCKALDNTARRQGAIGPYVGDNGKIYLSWSE